MLPLPLYGSLPDVLTLPKTTEISDFRIKKRWAKYNTLKTVFFPKKNCIFGKKVIEHLPVIS